MSYTALAIIISGLVTLALRAVPFLIFGGKKETPALISYLGRVLPCAIMGMLVVYCMRGISFSQAGDFVPALAACAVVVLMHVWRRSSLISIVSGTLCYMLLVQLIF